MRGEGEDLPSLFKTLNDRPAAVEDGRVLVLPPPPIQGIGNAGGFTMQIELRDGSFDLAKMESSANAVVAAAQTQSSIQRVSTPFRASAPQYKIEIDREKVQTLLLTTDQVFSTLAKSSPVRVMLINSPNLAARSKSTCRATRTFA